jgi:hypothetical protein
MDNTNRPRQVSLVVFAALLEVAAATVILAPSGSLLAPQGPPALLTRAAAVLVMVLAATHLWRLGIPGVGVGAMWRRPRATGFGRAVYYGLLAAVLISFFRAVGVTALNFTGTAFVATVGRESAWLGPFAPWREIVVAAAAAYFIFVYAQGTLDAALGARLGWLAAAVLYVLATTWPLDGGAARVGEHPPWLVAAAWRLPEGLALGFLGARTRGGVAPLTAAVLVAWVAAAARALFTHFGKWPFLFGVVILFLAATEIAIAERRRLGRAVGGAARLLLGRSNLAGLLDAVLFAVAFAGLLMLARGAALGARSVYVKWPVVAGVALGAAALWFANHFKNRRAAAASADDGGRA